jgi:hypothetical protein
MAKKHSNGNRQFEVGEQNRAGGGGRSGTGDNLVRAHSRTAWGGLALSDINTLTELAALYVD